MKTIYPIKLKRRDEIRVVALAQTLANLPKNIVKIAQKRLTDLGFVVTFSQNCRQNDFFNSCSIESRVKNFEEALQDNKVKMILAVRGGYNSNQLLDYLNYDLIKRNPKIICGYSDITAFNNAVYAKTGLVTYIGPLFSTFGMKKGFNYSQNYFLKALISKDSFKINPSKIWSDDNWQKNQKKRIFLKNKGCVVVNKGAAIGTICGGNLCTFNLLQGISYMPSLKNSIIFIEDDDLVTNDFAQEFERNLQSLLQQPDFKYVKGLVIGRFQKKCKMTQKKLMTIIKTKKELKNIPVIAGADFGHTTPQFTFPIGGQAKIIAGKEAKIFLLKY